MRPRSSNEIDAQMSDQNQGETHEKQEELKINEKEADIYRVYDHLSNALS